MMILFWKIFDFFEFLVGLSAGSGRLSTCFSSSSGIFYAIVIWWCLRREFWIGCFVDILQPIRQFAKKNSVSNQNKSEKMSNLLTKIISQAEKTFSCVNKEGFKQQISHLIRLVDGLTFADLKLSNECISEKTFSQRVWDYL